MAYNEEANIPDAIARILAQQLSSRELAELVVVASGCENRTAEIVGAIARRDHRARLLKQARREGKASAINLFITAARSPLLVMVSADVLLREGSWTRCCTTSRIQRWDGWGSPGLSQQ